MKRLLIVLLLCLCAAASAEESRDWSEWSWNTAPEPVLEVLPERVCHPEGELREGSPPEFSIARMHGYQGSGEYQLNIEHSRYFHCAGEMETP